MALPIFEYERPNTTLADISSAVSEFDLMLLIHKWESWANYCTNPWNNVDDAVAEEALLEFTRVSEFKRLRDKPAYVVPSRYNMDGYPIGGLGPSDETIQSKHRKNAYIRALNLK